MALINSKNNHRVLVIRVGYYKDSDDFYLNDVLRILRSQSSAVTVVSHKSIEKPRRTRTPKWISKRIGFGNWIPESFRGRFRPFFYILRTIFTILFAFRRRTELLPSIIFVDASCVALPLVKVFWNCPIVNMMHFQDLLAHNNLRITQDYTGFERFCLQYADDTLLPSDTSLLLFHNRTGTPKEHLTLMYPSVHGNRRHGKRYCAPDHNLQRRRNIIAMGAWERKSNFHAVFFFLEYFIKEHYGLYQNKYRFFILGYLDPYNTNQLAYREQIMSVYNAAPRELRDMLVIKTNVQNNARWALIRNADVICTMSLEDEFNWSILEGLYYGKGICCIKTPFASEVFVPDLNGLYFDPDNPETGRAQFRHGVETLLSVINSHKYSSYNANVYQKSFSLECRQNALAGLLNKFTTPE